MAKNRIMFINPPQSCESNLKMNNLKFPLGFLYMANHLEKNNFKIKILDCPLYHKKRRKINKNIVKIGLFPKEIKFAIKKFSPDIIGVSCAYTTYESDAFETIDLIRELEKEINKKFLIVVGGAHTSANPELVLRNKKINIAVIGEGEETILEIAKKYQQNKNLSNIKGTALRIENKIVINPPRQYIQNLDSQKPAWHLIDISRYFAHPDNSRATLRKNSVDIITSRGCPGNCVFCSIHTVWGRKWRAESPKKVADEIENLVKKYNAKHFRIQDDNFTLNRKRTIEICNEIIKRKLKIKWDTPNGIAFWTLDKQVLAKMKNAGCYRITLGVESACPKTQKYIRKIADLKKINEIIDLSHKLGLWIGVTFIVGFPYETREEINQTENYILNSKINFPFVYIAQPLCGTDLYKDFKKENLLTETKYSSNVAKSEYNTLYFSNEELNEIRNRIMKEFYFKKIFSYSNPIKFYREFLSKIKTIEDAKYVIKVFRMFAFKI